MDMILREREMSLAETVKEKREEILKVAARRGATNVRLFGSLARREERAVSDVDLLVQFEAGRSLLDLSHLLQDMEELLGCPVHVVEPDALHWAIRERIMEEAVPL
jgi:predicted nucleotidyltransferase